MTIIKLVSNISYSTRVAAVGCTPGTHFPDGFEISELSIVASCEANTGNKCLCGIAITGKNITVRNVEVSDFGAKGTGASPAYGISVAEAITSSAYEPYSCVVDTCRVHTPKGDAGKAAIAFHLGSSAAAVYHRALRHSQLPG